MGGIDVAALRAAAEGATPGPWDLDEVYEVWSQDADGQVHRIAATKYQDEDATYIAAANPAVVLALLDRLAVAEAAVDRVRALADHEAVQERNCMDRCSAAKGEVQWTFWVSRAGRHRFQQQLLHDAIHNEESR